MFPLLNAPSQISNPCTELSICLLPKHQLSMPSEFNASPQYVHTRSSSCIYRLLHAPFQTIERSSTCAFCLRTAQNICTALSAPSEFSASLQFARARSSEFVLCSMQVPNHRTELSICLLPTHRSKTLHGAQRAL
jgi:hypothetical protein